MTDEKSAFLFIDDASIENLDSVVQGVVPAKKVSPQPLIAKDRASEDEWLIGSYINVVYDDDENIFKMWYGVGRKLSAARGDQADGLAYAISQDGIHWEKPILNLFEDSGSKENDLVFPFGVRTEEAHSTSQGVNITAFLLVRVLFTVGHIPRITPKEGSMMKHLTLNAARRVELLQR